MHRQTLRAATFTLALSLFAAGLHAAEPQLVADLNPAAEPEETSGARSSLLSLGTVNGRALFYFFQASATSAAQSALWSSDGTVGGTLRLGTAGPLFTSSYGLVPTAETGALTFYFSPHSLPDAPQHIDLFRTDGTPEGTYRLLDAGTGPYQEPPSLAAFAGRAFFTHCGELGCEPWISDGTAAGTHLLRDLTPGSGGSEPREPVTFRGSLYFLANAPEGAALWRTDGTRRGTQRVLAFPTGVAVHSLTALPDRLSFSTGSFSGRRGGERATLWTSDGTAAGSRPIPPFATTAPGGPSFVQGLVAVAGRLYFLAWDAAARFQAWRSDGTAHGTHSLFDLGGSSYPAPVPESLGDRDYFIGPDLALWATRGTRATTRRVSSCRAPCAVHFYPLSSTGAPLRVGDRLLLMGADAASGFEPWVSDGTAAGTRRLADTCRGACDGYPQLLAATADRVYFTTSDGGIWRTDGTEAGTEELTRFGAAPGAAKTRGALLPAARPGAGGAARPGAEELHTDPLLLFAHFDAERGTEIWRSDGTPAGTRPVVRLSNGAGSNPMGLAPLGDRVLFGACTDGPGTHWTSDGTAAGTLPFFSSPICYLPPPGFSVIGGRAYFQNLGIDSGDNQFWSTDGTPAGTRQLTHFDDERGSSIVSADFQGGLLLLRNGQYASIPQLWRLDPTTEEATLLAEPPSGSRVWLASATADRIYFTVEDEAFLEPNVLWTSDGTQAGTRPLAVFPRGQDSDYPVDPVRIGDVTYLRIEDFLFSEIWRTDGTPAGTRRVFPHPDAPVPVVNPRILVGLRGTLLIVSQSYGDDPLALALIRSDGTVAGTSLLKVLALGAGRDSFDEPLLQGLVWKDVYYFVAATPEQGEELWRSDGTAAGTVRVRDIAPGPADSRIEGLRLAGGRLVFSADDGVHGAELWSSDGTEAGTQREGDIAPGPASSAPSGMTAAGGWLYFNADDGIHGRELWKLALIPSGPGATAPLRAHP